MSYWSAIFVGVNHLSMSKLNLKFKIFSELLVSNIRMGVNHLSMSKLNLQFKIFSEILVGDNGESIIFPCPSYILNSKFSVCYWSVIFGVVNHLSMSRLNLQFKIFSDILVGNNWGENHSQNMTLSELCLLHHHRSFLTKEQ